MKKEQNTVNTITEKTSDIEETLTVPEEETGNCPKKSDSSDAPQGEVVAESSEEKKMISEKESKQKQITELEEKNVVLEKEAEKFDNLASTMDTAPFIELKNIVKEALKNYVDRDDIKEAKKKMQNLDAFCQMENLLSEYKELAAENRQNIAANNDEIESYKERIAEIDEKLKNFQLKLV